MYRFKTVLFAVLLVPWLFMLESAPSADATPPALSDSDFILFGQDQSSPEHQNPRMLRIDKDGNVVWDVALPLSRWYADQDATYDRNVTEDAVYLSTFYDETKVNGKHRLLKFDASGSKVLDLPIFSTLANVSANPVGGGVYTSCAEGVRRIDKDGGVVWGPNLLGHQTIYQLCADAVGGGAYVIVDGHQPTTGVMKVGSDGTVLWFKSMTHPTRIVANPIDGGVYVTEYLSGYDTVRLDVDGNEIWRKSKYPTYWNGIRTASPLDGAITVTAWPQAFGQLLMDGSSNFAHFGLNYDPGMCGAAIDEKAVYVSRNPSSARGVAKFDSTGNLVWSKNYGPPSWVGHNTHVRLVTGTPAMVLFATVDFDPDTVNLKSKGKYVTVYIELDDDQADLIDPDTVKLTAVDAVALAAPLGTTGPDEVGDHDDDGVDDLMVKLDRADVIEILADAGANGDTALTFKGELSTGTAIVGAVTIRVK